MKIELNMKQLHIIESALNLKTRLGIGQLECIVDEIFIIMVRMRNNTSYSDIYDCINNLKKKAFDFQCGQSLGIGNKDSTEASRESYDMQKTIQKFIATKEKHCKHSVWHDGNICKYGKNHLIKITDNKKKR